MATTKVKKQKQVEEGILNLKNSQTVVFTDFTGLPVNEVNQLRKSLETTKAVYQVVKKRLLKFVFKELGMDFDAKQFGGQVGAVFSPKDIAETSQLVYKFSKARKEVLKILGGFDLADKKFIEGAEVRKIGQLPSREILLAQVVGTIAAPLKAFMYVLSETVKRQTVETKNV